MSRTKVTGVTVFPDGGDIDHEDMFSWSLRVQWRGNDRYAVLRPSGLCLSTTGEWDHEGNSSSRTDTWKATHRFSYDEALEKAQSLVNSFTVNGKTWAQAWDIIQSRDN